MRRFALYFLASFFSFGFGASLWFGYRALSTATTRGAVLGVTTVQRPSWQGATLMLTGENRSTLAIWSEGDAPTVIPETQHIPVLLAKATADGSTLLLVTAGGEGVQVFRSVKDSFASAPLVAVTGKVTNLQFSPNGQYVLFRLDRISPANHESDVLDITTGTIRRIANDADGAMWDANGDGILSWTSAGLLRLHTLSLDGTFQAPVAVRDSVVGNPIQMPTGKIVFILRTGDAFSVMTHDLVTKEERLLTPLNLPVATTSAQLISAPGAAHVLFRTLQKDVASSWSILDTANGTTKPATIATPSVVWEDANRFFFQGTDGMLHRYDSMTNTLQAFPTVNATTLP